MHVSSNEDDILRRVPPQNLEAEQSVLGAILLEKRPSTRRSKSLTPTISIASRIARSSA